MSGHKGREWGLKPPLSDSDLQRMAESPNYGSGGHGSGSIRRALTELVHLRREVQELKRIVSRLVDREFDQIEQRIYGERNE